MPVDFWLRFSDSTVVVVVNTKACNLLCWAYKQR